MNNGSSMISKLNQDFRETLESIHHSDNSLDQIFSEMNDQLRSRRALARGEV